MTNKEKTKTRADIRLLRTAATKYRVLALNNTTADIRAADITNRTCGLCTKYYKATDDKASCVGCPIAAATGKKWCEGTLHDTIDKLRDDAVDNPTSFSSAKRASWKIHCNKFAVWLDGLADKLQATLTPTTKTKVQKFFKDVADGSEKVSERAKDQALKLFKAAGAKPKNVDKDPVKSYLQASLDLVSISPVTAEESRQRLLSRMAVGTVCRTCVKGNQISHTTVVKLGMLKVALFNAGAGQASLCDYGSGESMDFSLGACVPFAKINVQ